MTGADRAREAVLGAVKQALATRGARRPGSGESTPVDPPTAVKPVPESNPERPARTVDDRMARLEQELADLHADLVTADSPADAAAAIADWLQQHQVSRVAVLIGRPGQDQTPACVAADRVARALSDRPLTLERLEDRDPEAGRRILAEAEAVLTAADHALAATGTLVFTGATLPDRAAAGLPRHHVAVVPRSALLPDLRALLAGPEGAVPDVRLLVTGPSRTADIEKELVLGAHGPGQLLVVVVPDIS